MSVLAESRLSEQARLAYKRMGRGYVLRVKSKQRASLVWPPANGQPPSERLREIPIEVAYELIDSGLLRRLEINTRNYRLGVRELGLRGVADFYCHLQ